MPRSQTQVGHLGKPKPTDYKRGERDFERMCETEELDRCLRGHAMALAHAGLSAAMRHGKHAATVNKIALFDARSLVNRKRSQQ